MTKLKREELLEYLAIGMDAFKKVVKKSKLISRQRTGELWIEYEESIEQAYQQIKELIQTSTNLKNKSLGRLAQDLGVSFSAAKIISDHAQPEVTEEWIEEKAREAMSREYGAVGCGLRDWKDFIRSLVEEIPTKKTTVTEKWVQEKAEDTASDYPNVAFPNLITIFKKLLKEAGVGVSG